MAHSLPLSANSRSRASTSANSMQSAARNRSTPAPRQPSFRRRRPKRGQLERYRRAFAKLLGRGEEFVKATGNPTLAAWAFTYLMHLLEDLSVHLVEVDGQIEPLMPHVQMSAIRLALLERYLGRAEPDLVAHATAEVHLAAAVREGHRYSVRDRERLDALGFRWAAGPDRRPRRRAAPRPSEARPRPRRRRTLARRTTRSARSGSRLPGTPR